MDWNSENIRDFLKGAARDAENYANNLKRWPPPSGDWEARYDEYRAKFAAYDTVGWSDFVSRAGLVRVIREKLALPHCASGAFDDNRAAQFYTLYLNELLTRFDKTDF